MPIAGSGSRFSRTGVTSMPKPLIRVAGRPLIEWATRNLDCGPETEWLFVARNEHLAAHPELRQWLAGLGAKATVHGLEQATASPLHTLLAAAAGWREAGVLLVTNCDQFLAEPIKHWLAAFEAAQADVGVLTVESYEAGFVHVEVSTSHAVTRVTGRGVSAQPAAAGYYFFRSGRLLTDLLGGCLSGREPAPEPCVTDLVAAAVTRGLRVCAWNLGRPGEKFVPLGDPSSVSLYESKLPNI